MSVPPEINTIIIVDTVCHYRLQLGLNGSNWPIYKVQQ